MIAYLRGRLRQITAEAIVLETSGIGWLVRTPAGQAWPELGTEIAVYTHLVVREDAMELYGFTRPEGLRFFTLLLGVAGIGPRGALQIMAAAPLEKLARAIAAEDASFLTALPGIGAKKARRLVLELKEAILKANLVDTSGLNGGTVQAADHDEPLAALVVLGYSREEVSPYLARVRSELGPEADTSTVLQAVLKALGRGVGNN